MNENVPSQVLAAGGSASLLLIIGVVIAGGLIAAFWYGSRRAVRRPEPPRGPQPRSDSWQTPDTPTDPHRRG